MPKGVWCISQADWMARWRWAATDRKCTAGGSGFASRRHLITEPTPRQVTLLEAGPAYTVGQLTQALRKAGADICSSG